MGKIYVESPREMAALIRQKQVVRDRYKLLLSKKPEKVRQLDFGF